MAGRGTVRQSAAVLCDGLVTLDDVRSRLASLNPVSERPAADHWAIGGPTLILAPTGDLAGRVVVDVVDHRWPEESPDPLADPSLFAAWTMRHFGPFAEPEGLAGALQQTWDWPGAVTAVERHRSFVRVRFIATAPDPSTAPLAELSAVTEASAALAAAPSALAYLNPNAQRLCAPATLAEAWTTFKAGGIPPMEAWTNRRLFQLGGLDGWVLMDTVGMLQLDCADLEVCFSADRYDPDALAGFLLNVSVYLAREGPVIAGGDTTDGPGGVAWHATAREKGLVPPQRRVLRWMPIDGGPVPDPLT